MNDISQILISSARVEVRDRGAAEKIPPLKKNEIIEAKVIESTTPHKAVLLIKGKRVQVRTFLPLQKGDLLQFTVDQVVPQKILRMLSTDSVAGKASLCLLAAASGNSSPYKSIVKLLDFIGSSGTDAMDEKIASTMRALKTLITGISLKSADSGDHDFLKRVIDGSGLTWEYKLKQLVLENRFSAMDVNRLLKGDLKGLTMNLIEDWKASEPISGEAIKSFVDLTEQLQLQNSTALEDKGKLFFSFPIKENDVFSFGQLLIGFSGNGEDKGEGIIRVSCLLDMSNLGPVRADMSILDRTVRGRLLVADRRIQSFVDEHIPDFKARFARLGFNVCEFVCAVEELETLEGASLAEELVDQGRHLLNLVV